MIDSEAGWRPNKLCPLCSKPLWYTGHVDITAHGDENVARARGAYICKTIGCDNHGQAVRAVD